jgi:hypothetical protein
MKTSVYLPEDYLPEDLRYNTLGFLPFIAFSACLTDSARWRYISA